LPSSHSRRGETGTLRHENAEPPGDARHMLADLQSVRRPGMERKQHAVETACLMRLGHGFDVVSIHHRPLPGDDFRGVMVANEADEFECHGHYPMQV
jgi:hypothetical protein